MNQTESKHSEDSNSNDGEINSQSLNVENGRASLVKCKRRSTSNKHISGVAETHTSTISTISQRPRRQVKHKFIKSANVNVIGKNTNNMTSSDVSDESTSLLSSLSPNKMRLVPMIHRLPINNPSKINWQDMIDNRPTESNEMQSDVVTVPESEPQPISGDMETERHNKLNNSRQTVRKDRQSQEAVCHGETTFEFDNANVVNDEQMEEELTVENTVTENNVTDGKSFNSFQC